MHKSMLLFFWVTCCLANAQQISGIVRDAETSNPVANVKISQFGDSTVLTQTDKNGYFILTLKQHNTPILLFSHQDYVPRQVQVFAGIQKANMVYISMLPVITELEAAQVNAIRAADKSPTTFSNISKKELAAANTGRDFPYLLQSTPATVVFSDAGAGIGYTGIRIRGVDQTRINVTINGIPVNDAESQGVFWVDLPDIASSAGSVQVQRGVGTSANGSAAFGASINVKTDYLPVKPFISYQAGAGSFNSLRNTLQLGTGELGKGWNVSTRLSMIKSDGFIDRASSDLKSWYVSGSKKIKNGTFKLVVFDGHERTYQAWYGVPQPKFKARVSETEAFISNLYLSDAEAAHLRQSNNLTYNPYTYKNQVDDYRQTYYQFFFTRKLKTNLLLNAAAYYTKGLGYYEEFKNNATLKDYGLDNVQTDSTPITQTDLVQRRWLNNDLYGFTWSVDWHKNNHRVIAGGGANEYFGRHFGQVIWATYASNALPEHEFYRNTAVKREFNQFVKWTYEKNRWLLFIDAQLRALAYRFKGPDNNLKPTDREALFLFFNPKAGVTYTLHNNQVVYASVALSQREPVRDDFVNSTPQSAPRPEQLTDFEAGYRMASDRFVLSVNAYLMNYYNQLVLTGKINDVGAYTRTNVAKSYRTGLETEFSATITKQIQWTGNASFSRNIISNFTEWVDDWDNWGNQISYTYRNTPIGFSPALVAGSRLRYIPVKAVSIDFISKAVSRQYLDNTGSELRRLDAFVIHDLMITCNANKYKAMKNLAISLLVNNLLNTAYAPNGYTFSGISNGIRNHFNYVYPQAGTNFMLKLAADF